MNILNSLVAARKARRIKQKEVAILLGVSPSHMSEMESGKKPMTFEAVERYASLVGVQITVAEKGGQA